MFRFLTALCALVSLIALPAHANDSEAETSLGGLTLKQSKHISMDSEDLFISKEQVRVKYRFTNHSDKDVTTLISFPLPTFPRDEEEVWFFMDPPDFSMMPFETKIDGKLAPLTRVTRAMLGERDITERVKALGWPVNRFGMHGYDWQFNEMSAEERQPFIEEGLIRKVEYDGVAWFPAWQVVWHITREQTFPAGKSVTVEHSYAPLTGGSVGGALHKNVRKDYPEGIAEYRKRYCVDDYFLKGFDKRVAAKGENGGMNGETWIGYVLSSGANWKGPIKDFRLVIDKGSTDNLVSFCMDGIKKIAPTQFEVRKKNFEPKDDLNILIVEWFEPNG